MPSRILEMIKAKVSQLPKEIPKPQKPIKEPKIKNNKKLILNYNFSQLKYIIDVKKKYKEYADTRVPQSG